MSDSSSNPLSYFGFGYRDALEIEKQEMEWLIPGLLPADGFGFIAGPPKAQNSPDGGKSILSRFIAVSIVNGSSFFDSPPIKKGVVLMVNLDEMDYKVSESVRNMAGGRLGPGLYISKAVSMSLPRDAETLKTDINNLKPSIVFIDPLLRTANGKDFNNNAGTGPIIDCLRRIQRECGVTMVVVHHCTKAVDRNKEHTSTWLSGSTDLDSSWDFCLCLEWSNKHNAMHLRCFYRYSERRDVYYRAQKDAKNRIIGIKVVGQQEQDSRFEVIRTCLASGNKTAEEIVEIVRFSATKVKRVLRQNNGVFEPKGKSGKAKIWGLVKKDAVQIADGQNDMVSGQTELELCKQK